MTDDEHADKFGEATEAERQDKRRKVREARQREQKRVERLGFDAVRTDATVPHGFLDETREGLPQGGLSRAQARLWRHALEGIADAVMGTGDQERSRERLEYPFGSVRDALARLFWFRADGAPVKSSARPGRFEAVKDLSASRSGGDYAQRMAELLDPVERAWQSAYDGPWDSGKVSEDSCRAWLLLRYVRDLSPRQIDDTLDESQGVRMGPRLIGRVTRYGYGRIYEYLAERELVPPMRRKRTEDSSVTDSDLFGWKEIADYLKRSVDTAKRWAREHGLPIRRFMGNVEASTEDIDAWRKQRTEDIQLPQVTCTSTPMVTCTNVP